MTIADIKKTAEQKMTRSVESFKAELQKIRTGRAHPGGSEQSERGGFIAFLTRERACLRPRLEPRA